MWFQHHRHDIHRVFLSSFSGILLSLSFPKTGVDFFSWFALVPFLYVLKDGNKKENIISGLSFGIAHFLTLLYWVVYTLNIYGYIPMLLCIPILMLLVLYLSCYPIFFAWFIGRAIHKPLYLIIVAPSLWVCLEYARAYAFSGFPWELLGYSQHRMIQFIQIADIAGVYGVSFLLVLVNTAVLTLYLFFSKKGWREEAVTGKTALSHGLLAILCVIFVWAYGSYRIHETDRKTAHASTATVSVIQGNIDQSLKWSPSNQNETIIKYRNLSVLAAKTKPDLIVWPETAAPFYYENDPILTYRVKEAIQTCGTEFLIGFPSFEKDMNRFKFFNSAYILNTKGDIEGSYSKVHLVPFGEYVPLQDYLPFIHKLTEQSGDFYAGKKGDTLDFSKGKIGVQICFEVIFPGLSRAMVKNGAQLIVNITNDAWFGKSSAPFQHFSMVKFRAVENKRAIARSANTGISGFIDPCGRVLSSTELYVDSQLTRKLPMTDTLTFYTRHGDVFVFLCMILLIPALLPLVRKKNRETFHVKRSK